MTEPLLQATGLARIYRRGGGLFGKPSEVHAVDGVDLVLAPGDRLGIVGESGCGKSTLGRLVLGITRPSAGAIRFLGQDHSQRSKAGWKRFRKEATLVQQNPLAALDPQMSIGAQVAEPLIVHGLERASGAQARAEAALAQVGLGRDIARRYPHELSGGQRQRVVIARALIVSPRLVVFDEAVSALDVSVQAQVVGIINRLQADLGLTSIFISHDLRIIRHVSDTIAVMYLGRIVERAPVDTIYRRPRHPYTQALLAAVPRMEARKRVATALVDGEAAAPGDDEGCRFRQRCPFATRICAAQDPVLRPLDGGMVACHRAEELGAAPLLQEALA